MKQCPVCKENTLKTREEELAKIRAKEIGDCFNKGYARIQDEWSLCSEICTSCHYVS